MFYEFSRDNEWFLRNEKGHIVSPRFLQFEDLADWALARQFKNEVQIARRVDDELANQENVVALRA